MFFLVSNLETNNFSPENYLLSNISVLLISVICCLHCHGLRLDGGARCAEFKHWGNQTFDDAPKL